IRNITPDQHVLGAPMTFQFSGGKLADRGELALAGSINRVKPEMPHDTLTVTADGYRFSDFELARTGDHSDATSETKGQASPDAKAQANSDGWHVHLTRGTVDGGANFTRKGDAIQGTVGAAFRDVKVE